MAQYKFLSWTSWNWKLSNYPLYQAGRQILKLSLR